VLCAPAFLNWKLKGKSHMYEKGKFYWFESTTGYQAIARYASHNNMFYTNEFYKPNGEGYFGHNTIQLGFCKGLATPAQIEQCLKAYAEKNGHVGSRYFYSTEADSLYMGVAPIYEKVKWAEIVKEPETINISEIYPPKALLEVVSYEGCAIRIKGNLVKISDLVEAYQQHLDNKTNFK
jgi:hypothetical protein